MSGLITKYLGKGLLDDRPESPDVAQGALALYLAEDTGELFIWQTIDPESPGWEKLADQVIDVDAPEDGKLYARKDSDWHEIIFPEPPVIDVTEAPQDGESYMRKDGAWEQYVALTIPDVPVQEAPTDGQQYARKDSEWVPVESGGSGGGIEEAPSDGKQYARQDEQWVPVSTPEGQGTGGVGAHKHWRLLITAGWNDENQTRTGLAELVLTDEFGGVNKAVGGIATASNGNAAAAFDSNPGTDWETTVRPYFIAYEFASPIQIVEFRMTRQQSNGSLRFASPKTGLLQYSDDGANWFEAFPFAETPWWDSTNGNLAPITTRDPSYVPPYDSKVPQGGAPGTFLAKKSATDGDTEFRALPLVSLTQAAYDALAVKDPNTYYFIIG